MDALKNLTHRHKQDSTMSLPLSGKVALVTGSSRGIGAAVAKRLAADGANVVVNYSGSAPAAEAVVQELNAARAGSAVAIQADVSTVKGNEELVAATLNAFGRIDIIVLNAGIMRNKTLPDIDEALYDQHFDINVGAHCEGYGKSVNG